MMIIVDRLGGSDKRGGVLRTLPQPKPSFHSGIPPEKQTGLTFIGLKALDSRRPKSPHP